MSDLFNRASSTLAGVLAADQVKLAFSGGLLRTLSQQLRFNYAQAVNQVYELGTQNIYYVVGRTQGQGSIASIAGPSNTVCEIYRTYGDACRAKENTITLSMENTDCSITVDGEAAGPSATFTLSFVVLTSVDFSVSAQDMMVNNNTAIRYGSLQCNQA